MIPRYKFYWEGEMYPVASIWWGAKGEIDHVVFRIDGDVKTLFKDKYDLPANLFEERQ